MSIEKELAGRPWNAKLKVGASDGSGFFYCGTVGDFITNMDDYSSLCEKNAHTSVIVAKKTLETRVKNPPSIDRFIRSEIKKPKHDFSLKNFEFYLRHYLDAIDRLTNAVDNAVVIESKFKHLDQREVVEIREASQVSDPGVLICIISGYEKGAYWTMDEAIGKHYINFSNSFMEDDDE